jgi:prolyl-tRNA synthetase
MRITTTRADRLVQELAPYRSRSSAKGKDEKIPKLARTRSRRWRRGGASTSCGTTGTSRRREFADADLIGIPVRVTVGKKTAEAGTVDVRIRTKPDQKAVPLVDLAKEVREAWNGYQV